MHSPVPAGVSCTRAVGSAPRITTSPSSCLCPHWSGLRRRRKPPLPRSPARSPRPPLLLTVSGVALPQGINVRVQSVRATVPQSEPIGRERGAWVTKVLGEAPGTAHACLPADRNRGGRGAAQGRAGPGKGLLPGGARKDTASPSDRGLAPELRLGLSAHPFPHRPSAHDMDPASWAEPWPRLVRGSWMPTAQKLCWERGPFRGGVR